eukprot:181714_1
MIKTENISMNQLKVTLEKYIKIFTSWLRISTEINQQLDAKELAIVSWKYGHNYVLCSFHDEYANEFGGYGGGHNIFWIIFANGNVFKRETSYDLTNEKYNNDNSLTLHKVLSIEHVQYLINYLTNKCQICWKYDFFSGGMGTKNKAFIEYKNRMLLKKNIQIVSDLCDFITNELQLSIKFVKEKRHRIEQQQNSLYIAEYINVCKKK